MRGIVPGCFAIMLATAGALSTAACDCRGTVTGPTAPMVTVSATLAPGEFRYLDVETPTGTHRIEMRFTVSSTTAPLHVRQVDPNCFPSAADTCAALSESNLTPRPPGVNNFGSSLSPIGARTRIVVQNASAEETITLTVTAEPRRPGCNR